jgi:signal transduction histidine kinase
MSTDFVQILLVDDTPENLVALEALLERDGVRILTASSGSAALEVLLAHDVSLALLDVQMPDMDGFELAELMRGSERTKRVPIIFVTAGLRDPNRVFKGYESGAVDFLYKPIDPMILRSKVDVFLELARQRREIEAELKLNETFMGILGHDLRNPLGAIMAGTDLLAMTAPDERTQGVLRRIKSSGRRMSEMIEALLDLTRARRGGGIGIAARTSVDAAELTSRAVDELRATHPGREVIVESSGDSRLTGDPSRLMQLLSNLVGNALVHGAKTAPVSIRVDGTARDLALSIHNDGSIPPDLVAHIFEPFRGRTTSSGLGLGLYISEQIAVAHGGTIEVVSTPGEGTTFTVRLPRA